MNFYFEAATILDRLDAKEGSVKGVLGSLSDKNRQRTSALVIETLKYRQVLKYVISEAGLLKEERKKITSLNLALVLVHDLLLSNGIQAGDGPIKQAILKHKTRLHAELQKLKIKRGVRSSQELVQSSGLRGEQIPRYVRVNTLLWSVEEAVQFFVSQGHSLAEPLTSSQGFAKDAHIPDLLLFPPQTSFHEDGTYKSGQIILQDKASCFPATVLKPPASDNAFVIDATAAPGNKTSHLSALMANKGKLYAFERDRRRYLTLEKMLSKAQCKNVAPINANFLSIDPTDPKYSSVTHILLDPSCSGSGIVNRLDHLVETAEEEDKSMGPEDRLNRLAGFQLLMVKHAMKFPAVQKIVYSTCSIHAVENEHVVRDALRSDGAQARNFRLAPQRDVLPLWPRRGLPEEMDDPEHAASLIRCSPEEDATNGFFVSCFVRDHVGGSEIQTIQKRDHDDDKKDVRPKKKRKRRLIK